MPRQLKNIIVTLMILLNVCVVVYFYSDIFSGNSDPPVKQAAVQQPVSAPQLAQPPVQQTAYQPPVQQPTQPQPTQRELQQQTTRAACDQEANNHWNQFMKEWPKRFDSARGDIAAETRTRFAYKQYVDSWRNYQVKCIRETQGTWNVAWGAEVENYARKNDCDVSASSFEKHLYAIRSLRSTERDVYVREHFGSFGKNTYRDFIDWYHQLKQACSYDLRPYQDWKAENVEKLIEQIRTVSR